MHRKWVLLGVVAMFWLSLAPSVFAGEDPPKVRVNISGLDMETLARQVERVTKRSFLFNASLLRSKRVTLQSESRIGPDEFYRVFQAICQMNGFAIVPVDGAGMKLEKIVKMQGARKEPGVHPVLIQGEKIPDNDTLVSYLAKLKHVTSKRVLPVLTPTLSASGSITQIPDTRLLLINDVASSIKRAEKMLTLLDVPGEKVGTADVPVKNLDAAKALTSLTKYLQALNKARTGEAGLGRLTVLPDERLNVLRLVGPEKEIAEAVEYLARIDVDSPTAKRSIRYYRLKNVAVADITDYVRQLLGVALASRTQQTEGSAPGQATQGATRTPQPVRPPMRPRPVQGQTDSEASADGLDIIPVDGLNTLVVAGDELVHTEVKSILENLDRRKGQVLIEVAIVQVTGDKSSDLGIEFLQLNDARHNNQQIDHGTGFGIGSQSDKERRGFPTTDTLSSIAGGAFRFVKHDQLQVLIAALATKSNVSIVSQPILLVNDNEQASFTTKTSEPTTTTSQGTATTNVSFNGFADATTALKITPHISPDHYVNMEITQTFEEFTGGAIAVGVPPPKVSSEATTKITIPDRKTIVLGGITRDSFTKSKSGVPGLMKIPGLGKLFSRESKQKTMSRLYLFVRPKILAMPDFRDLKKESEDRKDDVEGFTRESPLKAEVDKRIGRGDTEAEMVPLEVPKEEKP